MHSRIGFELDVPSGSTTVSIYVYSECGPIQIHHNLAIDPETNKSFIDSRFIRPESPVFNTFNTIAGGNLLLHLVDVVRSPVIDLTFVNTTSTADRAVGFAIGFDASAQTNGRDLTHQKDFQLALHDTVSCCIVLDK